MPTRILIINPHHDSARYVPMGSFGLCDYLARRGVEATIFNAALYERESVDGRLAALVEKIRPRLTGLVMHWKETLESSIALGRSVRRLIPETTIVAGGFTAGFFGPEILEQAGEIDALVRGDPERPLELLLEGLPLEQIPNLLFRHQGKCRAGEGRYVIDQQTLDSLSFAGIHHLVDGSRYLETVAGILGFPIFLGRGCPYDCLYCGGSREAFRRHSGRSRSTLRATASVLEDLHRLDGLTDRIYLCYESSPPQIREIFAAVAADPELCGRFLLNYGAWRLPDRELLESYRRAFRVGAEHRPIFELSPETALEEDRRMVRGEPLFFTNEALHEAIGEISRATAGKARIEVYFSRYHQTQGSWPRLLRELEGIHRFRQRLYLAERDNVIVTYFHLSTDPGSAYWKLFAGRRENTSPLELLREGLRRQDGPGSQAANNLCLYAPEGLDEETRQRFDGLVEGIELLLRHVPECYHILTRLIGFSVFSRVLDQVLRELADTGSEDGPNRIRPGRARLETLLDRLFQLLGKSDGTGWESTVPGFLEGLRLLYHRLLHLPARPDAGREGGTPPGPNRERGAPPFAGRAQTALRPRLDEHRLQISDYDYLSRPLIASLPPGDGALEKRPTLHVPGLSRIHSFPPVWIDEFRLLDGSRTIPELLSVLGQRHQLTRAEVLGLVDFIRRNYPCFTC